MSNPMTEIIRIRVLPATKKRLLKTAKDTNISMADVVRVCIDRYIESIKKEII